MTFTYSPNLPNPPDDPADDVSGMQVNSASISSIIEVDHVGFNLAGGGQHEQVTFNANNVPSSFPVTPGVLFTNTGAGGTNQLFFYSGTSAQSAAQYKVSGNGSALLLGGIIIKWGQINFSGGSKAVSFSTDSSNFPNNLFSVSLIANTITPSVNGILSFNGQSITGFTAYQNGSGSLTAFYIAIGN